MPACPPRPPARPLPGGDGFPESELGNFTPTFLWLLRDFYFDMSDGGREVGAWVGSVALGSAAGGQQAAGLRGAGRALACGPPPRGGRCVRARLHRVRLQ
jgi:hypothetical protein